MPTTDRRGEPTDPVHAVSDGEVAFINPKPGLSNYGRYIVLRHRWDGIEVFTLYAHLREVAEGLVMGQFVRKGQVIATLGHSTNTREGISRDRAQLHFKIDVMFNPHFHIWYPKRDPQAPPFGNFNGLNLWGMYPAAFFRTCAANPKPNGAPGAMNFAEYANKQPIAFTVLVNAKPFPWLAAHPEQVHSSNVAAQGTAVAYEIGSTWFGLPIAVWPRAGGEISETERCVLQRGRSVLHWVDEVAIGRNPCRDLVRRSGRGWQFTRDGQEWIELLTYTPETDRLRVGIIGWKNRLANVKASAVASSPASSAALQWHPAIASDNRCALHTPVIVVASLHNALRMFWRQSYPISPRYLAKPFSPLAT